MKSTNFSGRVLTLITIACVLTSATIAGTERTKPKFRVIAFFTGKSDLAHVSFVKEANEWFPQIAAKQGFSYDTTSNWKNLNPSFLSSYQVVLFLDTRPENPGQRAAFENYMRNGGAWMGFHFSAFALSPSSYPQNWNWYHNDFLGSGSYAGNTWRPTSAVLKVEDAEHPVTRHLPPAVNASPNEWYKWENDLRKNPDINILLSIDSTSFPLGTGPKPHEIWNKGYYPVVWSNKKYNMIYINMGHNDIDYEHKFDNTNKTLSYTFANETMSRMVIDAIMWLGRKGK